MAEDKEDSVTFEASLKTLEEAVDQLEAGNLPLSDALKLFEQGLKASNACRTRLEDAKQKVDVLVKDNAGGFHLEELDQADVSDEEESSVQGDELPF
ncbi:MAG TPA: exodeoxyribonuclease VII small subunit [Candidatus Latescibacteria bacterium]|jgi:exodeoxyribonuclease VII small subunit|nr:exodeoxyribonuclease VII small subunit [Candidatus Latescibacterota bacterium]